MKEAFLHFLWRTRRFDPVSLHTTEQQPITVLQPGSLNTHAGPDFFHARIRIGDMDWVGNVEMHLRSSEWMQHGHQHDRSYDNVVLHVVWEEDEPILRPNGSRIPCLELKDKVDTGLVQRYQQLMQEATQWIPCAAHFGEVPEIIRLNWLDRLTAERLEHKTKVLDQHLSRTEQHWEEAFYRVLARSFGLKVNSDPFEMLASSIPLSILGRHKTEWFQLEALLFGQAGLLEGPFEEVYPNKLAQEYRFLKHKYQLTPIEGSNWKFLRLRPANFPTVRIAQFAALVHQSSHLFAQVIAAEHPRELYHLLQAEPSAYWLTHYRFDVPAAKRSKRMGEDFVHTLLINTIIPTLFLYGQRRALPDLQTKALRWLDELRPESNALIEGWQTVGIRPRNGCETQALLQLKTQYCDAQRCLECAVGGWLIHADRK